MKKILLTSILFWLIFSDWTQAGEQLQIFVSIPPLKSIVESIGAEQVSVAVLVQPGQSPHTFEPTPGQMLALSAASLYFTQGLPFESKLVAKIRQASDRLEVIDISAGIARRKADPEEGDDHEHTEDLDPHVWLSPPNIALLAANIKKALSEKNPDKSEIYEQNYRQFAARLMALDARIRQMLTPLQGKSLFVFHPAFGYFADYYGLKQVAVETGGKSPTPRQIEALIRKARAEQARVIFVQPQYDRATARAIAEAIGGAVVSIDPQAENLLVSLEEMAAKISAALK